MSATGLEALDSTLQTTHLWLNDVMRALSSTDRRQAYAALRATLHALRDRLTVEEVAQLGAQFPTIIWGVYYEGWDPTGKPLRMRRKEDFLERVEWGLRGYDELTLDAERVARAVFAVLAARITAGEIEDVTRILPTKIRDLWPSGPRVEPGS
jgi:uncharacterized protein (DUF2267 family)